MPTLQFKEMTQQKGLPNWKREHSHQGHVMILCCLEGEHRGAECSGWKDRIRRRCAGKMAPQWCPHSNSCNLNLLNYMAKRLFRWNNVTNFREIFLNCLKESISSRKPLKVNVLWLRAGVMRQKEKTERLEAWEGVEVPSLVWWWRWA